MATERPLVAVLNTNSRVMMPDEFARYEDRLQFRHPPAAARASDARNAVDAAMATELLAGADGCITCWGSPPISADLLGAAPNLRIIAHAAGTLRPYLTPAVWERDIAVVSAAGAIAEEVAQYTAALIVIGRRSLMELAPQTAQGKWRDVQLHRPSSDVRGITVGIIGAGEVGRRVLALLGHFQVRLLLADPFVSADQAAALGAEKRELEALFAEADVVSVHAPNNDQTRHMVNAERLALLRDGAILINTSRGPLVDQEALVAELHRRRIWAFIDVTDPEPPPPASALFGCPHLTLSPHVAGSINGSGRYQLRWVLDEVARLFAGEPLLNPQTRAMVEMSSFR